AVQHQQRGEFAQAERLYAQVFALDPGQPDAHHFMGLLAHQTGRQGLAEEHMRRSLALAPQRAEFRFNYANMLLALGRPQEAAQEFQQTVDLAPQMVDAWQGLGTVLQSLQHEMHAAVCFQRVVELAPARGDAWQALGSCFQSMGLLPEAVAAYRRAIALSPNDALLRTVLISALMESREETQVATELDQLLKLAPNLPQAHYQRGVWLANKGDFPAARMALERAIELAPDYYQAALYLAYITPLPPDAPLVQRLTQRAREGGWRDPGQGANVHFTLGYVLDKDKQYDAAFGHYLEANRLQRSLQPYSTTSQRGLQESMQRAFGPAFLERARRFGNPSAIPLFIVGMPRSGTSLLEQILASHPLVHGGGEMLFLHAELRRRLGLRFRSEFAEAVAGLPDAELADLAAALVAHLDTLAPGARHVTDKMPSNFMLLGLLHALFPNARFIHCRRDPLDTCISCFTTSFKQGHKFTNDLTELGEYYRLYEEALGHWQALLPPGSFRELSYERLVEDLDTEVRGLLEFCGLPWDEACLHFQDNARAVSTASVYQVRQPIYRSAIGRWKRYEKHLGPLQRALAKPT
ncbi:MAG TPA: sulfotransferase, partial [Gammaproteobacteria bacterium]|nr:sulfotransferase [Gammaproteobacteria bacterium]